MNDKWFMAVDQYGQTYHGLKHPRKDLMMRIGNSHADKMYCESKDGKTYHVGYVIGSLWLNIYEVTPMRKEA